MKKISFFVPVILVAGIITTIWQTNSLLQNRGQSLRGQLVSFGEPASFCLLADMNNDGSINIVDLVHVGRAFGMSVPIASKGDLNKDGTLNIVDLALMARYFGEKCADIINGPISVNKASDDHEGIVIAGEEETLGTFDFTNGGPDIVMIDTLNFQLLDSSSSISSSTTDNISLLKLYTKDKTSVGNPEGYSVEIVSGRAYAENVRFQIPASSTINLTVKGVMRTIAEGADSGDAFSLFLSGEATKEGETLREAWGSFSARGSEKVVYKTKPIVSVTSVPGARLATSIIPVMRFSITADPAGNMSWKKIQLKISTTGARMDAPMPSPLLLGPENMRIISLDTSAILSMSDAYSASSVISASLEDPIERGKTGYLTLILKTSEIVTAGSVKTYEINLPFSDINPVPGTAIANVSLYLNETKTKIGSATRDEIISNRRTDSFVWSDMSNIGHSEASKDWQNGRYVLGLPSNSIVIGN
ncbi:hypothetical protein A3A21_03980 [Candidatus Jorgensenbacteria bacterium RIFCSPLOWO2_01_FULL_45_25b]|uniref:Dockerin domain-containing protein n=1 Tax=Candidatus Jorgensenbacteria bacterium RIFCSPLOWO2_01_FULL_45_25b TaxID=1798471 RepID=A0A1F6BWF8_9BACT|nr:MAG: hypothetical protein A3A21_03980 [Candidatus Jorgensenbacteria bacterium RIFCSPLOWO2_01_FULL_45_25b]